MASARQTVPGADRASWRPVPPVRRLAWVALVVLATAAGGSWLVHELGREERDRHAIQDRVGEIERKLWGHDAGMWLLPDEVPDGHKDAVGTASHQRLRDDLDRLAHLENLRLGVREIRIVGDEAFASYAIEGTAWRRGEPKPPRGGQFSFRRVGDRWLLSENRFDEVESPG